MDLIHRLNLYNFYISVVIARKNVPDATKLLLTSQRTDKEKQCRVSYLLQAGDDYGTMINNNKLSICSSNEGLA